MKIHTYMNIRHINKKTQYLDNLIQQQKSILQVPSKSKFQAHTVIKFKDIITYKLYIIKEAINYLGFLICTLRRSLNIL